MKVMSAKGKGVIVRRMRKLALNVADAKTAGLVVVDYDTCLTWYDS